MGKRSVLAKILVVVILALVVPAIAGALDVACQPGYYSSACPSGTYDCTSDWAWQSWSNFEFMLAAWYSGYAVLICCFG